MFGIHSRATDREILIITNSPPEQFSKIQIKSLGGEIRYLDAYGNAIIVFDDYLESSNGQYIGQIFIGWRHNNLDICYLSLSYLNLPKTTETNNSNRIILYIQTLKGLKK